MHLFVGERHRTSSGALAPGEGGGGGGLFEISLGIPKLATKNIRSSGCTLPWGRGEARARHQHIPLGSIGSPKAVGGHFESERKGADGKLKSRI